MSKSILKMITPWRLFLVALFAVGIPLLIMRYAMGLGAVTNLSDQTPWGIWVGFDILAGIGLAAGGFVMAATVYVFRLEKFRPLVRMSILTAMLGYLIFIVGLLIEIGRPWNMWRVITDWNIHSPLFEIAWCVILYTTVLILEFSGVVFEKFGLKKLEHVYHKVTIVLVILGIMLSTLHQSTLGTLFAIAVYKMHPLWYSQIQPVHFYTSCIAAGMLMVCFESYLSKRFSKHPVRMDLLPKLAMASGGVLVIYFIIRIADLVVTDSIGHAFEPGLPAAMFWLESALFVIIPLVIIFSKRSKITETGLFFASFSGVLGFILHRFNVAITSFETVNPTGYFPAWTEFVATACLISAAFIAAGLAVHFFPIHTHESGCSHE